MTDPKPPHNPHAYGSLSFASSSSKNSSTSQFFITLADPSASKDAANALKKKLDGKYYPFGFLDQHSRVVLDKVKQSLGNEKEWNERQTRGEKCWISACGVVEP